MGWSNLGQKLARIGRDTKNGVQKMSDSVSIKGRISAEKRSLERLFAVIGESVYKENPDSPRNGLEDEYAAVKVAYANIEKYSKQLDEVNGIVYCPNCGKPADPGDKFCAKCGARLSPEEGAGAKVAQDFREVGQEVGKLAGSAADKTGEFFGSAAAKTKNGFTSLKERSAKFVKDTSRKLTRRMEDVPQDPELTGNLQSEQTETGADTEAQPADKALAQQAETGADTEAQPADAALAQQAADTDTPVKQAEDAKVSARQAADTEVPAHQAQDTEIPAQQAADTEMPAQAAEAETAEISAAEQEKAADEAAEDGKDRKAES